jgi:hypothetical protein
MSAGSFQRVKYETARGDIVRGLIQPEVLTLTVRENPNTERTIYPLQAGWPSAIMRGSRRSPGIHARKIRLKLNAGQSPPDGYSGQYIEVPILMYSTFNGIQVGFPAVYLGRNWTVVSKIPEVIN